MQSLTIPGFDVHLQPSTGTDNLYTSKSIKICESGRYSCAHACMYERVNGLSCRA